jgi:hypothetical protein
MLGNACRGSKLVNAYGVRVRRITHIPVPLDNFSNSGSRARIQAGRPWRATCRNKDKACKVCGTADDAASTPRFASVRRFGYMESSCLGLH